MPGTLYGVGVGPGDPELMTVKAARILGAAPVVAHFAKRGQAGNARTTAGAFFGPQVTELRLDYPVTVEVSIHEPDYGSAMTAFYDESAARVRAELEAGRDVALLCEGDPFFYGSFMYLYHRLSADYPTEVVPGVTGMSGCWTRAGLPMTYADDVLTVVPGTLEEAELARRFAATDALVVMKVGRNFARVRRALAAAGLLERAVLVVRGTQPGEEIHRVAAMNEGASVPYFSIVLVPGRQRRV